MYKNDSGQFKPGDPKPASSGRKKKPKSASLTLKELCQAKNVDILAIAVDVVVKGKLPGAKGRIAQLIPDKDRLRVMESLLPLLTPKLSSSTVAAEVQVHETTAQLDVTELMKNPELARAAQTLALGMVDAEQEALRREGHVFEQPNWKAIDGRNGDE